LPAGFVPVAREEEVVEGRVLGVHVMGHPIALCRLGSRIYACSAACTHEDGDLTQGEVRGHEIRCPDHGSTFDFRTGRVLDGPAEEPLATYEVRVERGVVYVASRPRGF
jgi:nitrite reductase/ring-hydroxylating ferredoxin subunit